MKSLGKESEFNQTYPLAIQYMVNSFLQISSNFLIALLKEVTTSEDSNSAKFGSVQSNLKLFGE